HAFDGFALPALCNRFDQMPLPLGEIVALVVGVDTWKRGLKQSLAFQSTAAGHAGGDLLHQFTSERAVEDVAELQFDASGERGLHTHPHLHRLGHRQNDVHAVVAASGSDLVYGEVQVFEVFLHIGPAVN